MLRPCQQFFSHALKISCLTDFVLFVCFVALRPKLTAMVIAGGSVHFFLGKLEQAVFKLTSSQPVLRAHTLACNLQQPFLNDSAEGRRMTVENIS